MSSSPAVTTEGVRSGQDHRVTRGSESQAAGDGDSGDRPRPTDLSLDMIFEVLKNQRRRRVLAYLEGETEPVRLGELAEHVAALENDKSVAALSASERKCVYVGLYQCHLPKMDDLDVVEFNKDRGLVELGANVELLDPYLDRDTDEPTRPWYKYYAAIGGVGLLLVAVSQVAALPTTGLFLPVLLAFLACTTAHAYTAERDHGDS